ncbi:MAG TPA: hypothetical protein VFO77_08460, partial [Actinoplanes sp.]|nr:hypothetical protein [Actinoplanes sp.]
MSMLAVKLRRDLRAEWARLWLMTTAIVVSLVVFGGVLAAYTGIKRETVAAYANTRPASATFVFSDDVDAGRLSQVAAQAKARPGILDAAPRSQFTSEVRVGGLLREAPAQVFVAAGNDPMTMANFRVDNGAWPPAAGDVLVRADA